MFNAKQPSGLMHKNKNDSILKLRDRLFGSTSQPKESLNDRIDSLTGTDRSLFEFYTQAAIRMMKQQYALYGHSKVSYGSLLSQMNKGMKPQIKSILVEALELLAPVEVREASKKRYTVSSVYDDSNLLSQPDLKQKVEETVADFQAASLAAQFKKRKTQRKK